MLAAAAATEAGQRVVRVLNSVLGAAVSDMQESIQIINDRVLHTQQALHTVRQAAANNCYNSVKVNMHCSRCNFIYFLQEMYSLYSLHSYFLLLFQKFIYIF